MAMNGRSSSQTLEFSTLRINAVFMICYRCDLSSDVNVEGPRSQRSKIVAVPGTLHRYYNYAVQLCVREFVDLGLDRTLSQFLVFVIGWFGSRVYT